MTVFNLGTRRIPLFGSWVSFNGVELNKDQTYMLRINQSSPAPELLYSYILVGFMREITTLNMGILNLETRFFYDSITQVGRVFIPKTFDGAKLTVFRVRRLPTVYNISNSSVLDVTLIIDDAKTE
jgi:hypothetical protein